MQMLLCHVIEQLLASTLLLHGSEGMLFQVPQGDLGDNDGRTEVQQMAMQAHILLHAALIKSPDNGITLAR